jgi:hypothetical protein
VTLILLEGTDGTGKSSLAAAVVEQLERRFPHDDVELLHSGPLKQDPKAEYVYAIDAYEPNMGKHIVADRWHLGELIYGPLYREKSAIDEPTLRWIEQWLASRGAELTLVTNTLDEVTRRLEARGEDFLQPEHVELVLNEFTKKARASALYSRQTVVEGDLTDLASWIVESAVIAESQASEVLDGLVSYAGPLYPHTLLVGEKRGGKPPHPSLSAFVPVNGNSATFLWGALRDNWKTVGVVNAKEESPDALVEWVEAHPQTKVVALGREATKWLTKAGIEHGTVPHPQWVRRFKNKRQVEYGLLINHAAAAQEDHLKWLS